MEQSDSLGTALPKQMARVRDVVMPAYIGIGPAGGFALALIKADLDRATKALAEGDLPGMITAYKSLCEYKI